MKFVFTLTTTMVLSLFCNGLVAQENPFMQMVDKKYVDYSQHLYNEYLHLFHTPDSLEAFKIIRQIREVAQKTGSMEWKLQADYFESVLFDRKLDFYGNEQYPPKEYLQIKWELLERAKKANLPPLELRIRQDIIRYHKSYSKNYEVIFEQYAIQDEQLQKISSDDVPEKTYYYMEIADAYYSFKDYPKAIYYYNKILEEKLNTRSHHFKQHARNGIGLCYRYGYNDLDRSDSCFRSLVQDEFLQLETAEFVRESWKGISEGNIGHNMLLREAYNEAIPLLKSSLERMLKYNDYGYSSGIAIHLADIYMRTNHLAEAKRSIDLASDCYRKEPREGRIPRIYELLSKYYTATGNKELSLIYMDSMLTAKQQHDEQFNAMLLLRMEQKELAKQHQEFVREKEKRQQAQIRVLILSVGFVVIFSLLGVVSLFYRKKRTAYRELVRKSQEWAHTTVDYKGVTTNGKDVDTELHISEVDRQLFEQLQQLFQLEHLYRQSTISVEEIAHRMKVNRTYLSRAVNHCTGKNFNAYINEYRIKEAVRLMSADSKKFSLEGLAFEVGFNDRKTFYTAFKKTTGLSPSDFRNNLHKK